MDEQDREWVSLGSLSAFPEQRAVVRLVDGHEIAVFRIDNAFYAVSNVCPHQHIPLMAEGSREGLVVTCPMHGWSYRLDTGEGTGGSGSLKTFTLRIEHGELFVARPPEPAAPMWE